jgi:ribosomal protein S5
VSQQGKEHTVDARTANLNLAAAIVMAEAQRSTAIRLVGALTNHVVALADAFDVSAEQPGLSIFIHLDKARIAALEAAEQIDHAIAAYTEDLAKKRLEST